MMKTLEETTLLSVMLIPDPISCIYVLPINPLKNTVTKIEIQKGNIITGIMPTNNIHVGTTTESCIVIPPASKTATNLPP